LVVPKSIKSEIELKEVEYHGRKFRYKIKYPAKYSRHKTYRVFLALAGGNQREEEVDYSYYTGFRSAYLDKYIIIMPINIEEESLKEYGNEEILDFYDMLIDKENVTKGKWVIGGMSNGGVAAFNFLITYPDFFEGIIVMPGMIHNNVKIPKEWHHLRVVLAYGEKDTAWKNLSEKAYHHLSNKIKYTTLFEMKGQKHVIKPDYNIDNVYKQYFK